MADISGTPCSIDWRHPRVRDVLRDYKNQKINSREGAELITKITGSPVSTTTVRAKSRMLDELVSWLLCRFHASMSFMCFSYFFYMNRKMN